MPEQIASLIAFLRKTFIFSSLSDEALMELARSSEVIALQKGELLYTYGAVSSDFCMVWTGKICLKVHQGKAEQMLGTLIAGDYFGEDFLLGNKRPESAFAVQPSKVIRINRDLLLHLLQGYPKIYQLILATAKSRQFIRLHRFKWLNADEAIYMVTRKHEFFLAVHLILPALAALLSLTVGAYALFARLPSSVLFGALFMALCKRRHELLLLGDEAPHSRSVLKEYSSQQLDLMIAIVCACVLMSYALYAVQVPGQVGGPLEKQTFMLTLPLVIYGVFRYLHLAYHRNIGGSPEYMFKDRAMLLCFGLWTGLVVIITSARHIP